ncbi:MAG: carboxypeptidase regulatory-like domain-containing protein, partial [Saprospiraceae bacterium]|nr:carboxypeptidase regulatory-like domain-containing protein [Pyrinomonadaceae bacterium]
MPVKVSIRTFLLPILVIFAPFCILAQDGSGKLFGKVTNKDGSAVAGVVVTATNQTSSEAESETSKADGSYTFKLRAGAYKLSAGPPFEARFDRGKSAEYGSFSNLICDESKKLCPILENIIIGGGDRKIDFIAEQPTDAAKADEKTEIQEPDRRELRDRWRIEFPEYDRYGDKGARGRDIPFKRNRWYNPYDQNVIKGDKPIFGDDYFLILSGVSTTGVEIRRTPSATSVSASNPDSNNFLGRPESLSLNQTIQLSFEFFKGQTVFRPRSWAIKISPTFSLPNYLNARENGIVNIDPRRGTNRTDYHASLEEAFAEVKLFDTNDNFDSVSVRAGIQPFIADFRGFLYSDNNLGVRLFGAFSNNKLQFNAAYFRQLEKDTNSNLNALETPRHQDVFIANFFRQDFLFKGYTIQGVGAYNNDREDIHYDTNGFLVRPALVGNARPHSIKAGYLGINGDG